MPAAVEYVPPTSPDRNTFNFAVNKERTERKRVYDNALKYYLGNPDDPIPPDPENPDYDASIDSATVNLTKMAADRTVSFLFPEMPVIQTDPESVEDTEEEKWLKDVFFPSNGGLASLIKWALRGFLAGHSYIWLKPKKPTPRMVVLQPLSVTVFWRADDVADVLWYEMRYQAAGIPYIRDFVRQSDDTWKIYEYKGVMTENTRAAKVVNQITAQGNSDASINIEMLNFGTTFEKTGELAHDSEIPPIIDVAHLPHPDDFYGLGEFTQKDLQDIINVVMALRNRIVRENSDPVDVVDGDIDEIQDEGSIIQIPTGSKITRLSLDSDLNAINEVINDLMEKFLAVARVVILKGEAKDLQRVTNAAVRTLFLDALAKNAILKSAYGTALAKIAKLALEMAYALGAIKQNPAELAPVVDFASPLPTDLTEVANINALALNGKYMSKHSAAVAIGLDPAFENKKIEVEREQEMAEQEEQLALMASFAGEGEDSQNENNPAENTNKQSENLT